MTGKISLNSAKSGTCHLFSSFFQSNQNTFCKTSLFPAGPTCSVHPSRSSSASADPAAAPCGWAVEADTMAAFAPAPHHRVAVILRHLHWWQWNKTRIKKVGKIQKSRKSSWLLETSLCILVIITQNTTPLQKKLGISIVKSGAAGPQLSPTPTWIRLQICNPHNGMNPILSQS